MKESESWSKVLIIYSNGLGSESTYNLTGEWHVAFTSGTMEFNEGDTLTESVTVGKYSMAILYQE